MTDVQRRFMEFAAEQELLQLHQIDINIDHPVDDVNLLMSWSLGDISQSDRDELIQHLANCVYCRRETAIMIREGVLVFEEPHVPKSGFIATLLLAFKNHSHAKILLTIAAVLTIAFVGFWMLNLPHNSQQQIARVLPSPSNDTIPKEPAFEIWSLEEMKRNVPVDSTTKGARSGVSSQESLPDQEQKTVDEIIIEIKSQVGDDPEKLFQESKKLLMEGLLDEAIAILEELGQNFPTQAAVLNALGIAYHLRGGRPDEAYECLTKAKELDPNNQQIQENLDY